MKASPLLRAWLRRLDGLGVELRRNSRWSGFSDAADITILAMGGASWPKLGSDGSWVPQLRAMGVVVNDFTPANCGVITGWSPQFSQRFAGTPLKRVAISCSGQQIRGEAVVTRHGLQGGAIYALTRRLRDANVIIIDLRPDLTAQDLTARMSQRRAKDSTSTWLRKSAGLPPVAVALLREAGLAPTPANIKSVSFPIKGLEGLERAISSAGGIARHEVDETLQLRRQRGVYAVGEMLDWEAPTGGYLLQACFSTGHWAATCALSQ